jgi:hypothetical protein
MLGYRGFGSFLSDNLEELIAQPDEGYTAPAYTRRWDGLLASLSPATPLGPACRESLFCLESGWTFLNHGAFGGPLRPVLEAAQGWQWFCESQPLRCIDRELLPMLAHALRVLSGFLGLSRSSLALLPNVTSGLNAVAASVVLSVRCVSSLTLAAGRRGGAAERWVRVDAQDSVRACACVGRRARGALSTTALLFVG